MAASCANRRTLTNCPPKTHRRRNKQGGNPKKTAETLSPTWSPFASGRSGPAASALGVGRGRGRRRPPARRPRLGRGRSGRLGPSRAHCSPRPPGWASGKFVPEAAPEGGNRKNIRRLISSPEGLHVLGGGGELFTVMKTSGVHKVSRDPHGGESSLAQGSALSQPRLA